MRQQVTTHSNAIRLERLASRGSPSGDCLEPIIMELQGKPYLDHPQGMYSKAHYLDLPVRCRQCENCLKHRRRLWTARAIDECALSHRNWFGTLTIRPEDRVRYLYTAQLRNERATGDSWGATEYPDQYRYLCMAILPHVTKFLKRVRKNAGTPFRYLLVTEAHEDGFPHLHMILHESEGSVRKTVLEAAWRSGFSHWRLLPDGDPKGAYYACKYLSKSALTRIRASQRYGQEARKVRILTERICGASRVVGDLAPALGNPEPSPGHLFRGHPPVGETLEK